MAAAVVELDALSDAVRAAAEDDHLLAARRLRLVRGRAGERCHIGRVHVGGGRGELRGAGIDALEDRPHAERATLRGRLGLGASGENRKAGIGKTHALQMPECSRRVRQAVRFDLLFDVDDRLELLKEPAVDLAGFVHRVVAHAEAKCLRDLEEAVRRRRADRGLDGVLVVTLAEPFDLDLVKAGKPGLERAQRLLQRFRKGAPDCHRFADRFHRGRERRLGAGEFFEREARDLGDDVVDRRLERGRRRTAGDVVRDLVQGVADGKARRDLGDRKARRLRREGRGARHARVHLDHDHAPVLGIDRELHVRAARLDADLSQDRDRGVAHDLVFLVGQRQRRGDGDRSRRCARPSGRYSRSSTR